MTEKVALAAGSPKRDAGCSPASAMGSPGGSRVLPWLSALVVFSVAAWCLLAWRHIHLEWRMDRLEGELEARLEQRLHQLGVKSLFPPAPTPTHTRVARDVASDNCLCPPGERAAPPRPLLTLRRWPGRRLCYMAPHGHSDAVPWV